MADDADALPEPWLEPIVQACLDQLQSAVQDLSESLAMVDLAIPEYVGWMTAVAAGIAALGKMTVVVAEQMRLLHEFEQRGNA
jgi:hypothetical protein